MENIDYIELVKYYGKEILESKNFQKEKQFIQHGNVSVYEHSILVAIECIKIAYKYGIPVDLKTLIRGSLLHDFFLYDWHIKDKNNKWHGVKHAKRALENAKKEFELNEIEQNMIYCHMFPLNLRIPKYRESAILCIADKISATKETISPYIEIIKRKKQYTQ